MSDEPTYDVWVIHDPDGPVLYFPVPSASTAAPRDHVAALRHQAVRVSAPDGLIEGVWARARARLAGPPDRLVAEIADAEVETRRAAQRAATMARGADSAAWAPEELLAEPEPARRSPAPASSSSGTSRPRPATRRRPRAKPGPTAPARPRPAEPEEAMCPTCHMMRRRDQFDGDLCEFCA